MSRFKGPRLDSTTQGPRLPVFTSGGVCVCVDFHVWNVFFLVKILDLQFLLRNVASFQLRP